MPAIPAVYLEGEGENHPLEKYGEMDLDPNEEASSITVPSTSTGYSSYSSSGDKYLTIRRHTVGPGDSAHEQVLENHYISHPQQDQKGGKLLPHTNLPLHITTLAQQNPHYFGGKDPHLLKPPVVLSAAGGFGRRASDGGANLHMVWGTPGSHEQLSMMSTSSSGNPSLSSSGTGTQPQEHNQHVLEDLAVARYMQGRGNSKRHTMASPEDVHSLQSTSSTGTRVRRTGLLTVTERPVIPPEVVMEVEARMNRNYMPTILPQRKHSRQTVKPHLPTVQELQGREQKSDRFSPVRRGSEGSASCSRSSNCPISQQESQRMQRSVSSRNSPPRSIPGSPIHQKFITEAPMRHHMSECTSPIHQFYQSLPEAMTMQELQNFPSARDPTLGLPPENYQQLSYGPYESTNRSPTYSYDSINRSPLHSSPYTTTHNSNLNSPINQGIFSQVSNLAMYSGSNSPILNTLLSPNTSPVFGGFHQATPGSSVSSITQGISGLNTTSTGSITQGIPSTNLQMEMRNQQLHEDKMDTTFSPNLSYMASTPQNFLHILNIHGHRSLTNSPTSNPGSPGLDMIQEELPIQSCTKADPGHPQISVTDVLGSEVTLIAGSDTSEDSMDSLENQKMPKIPSFIISEPADNSPSITRGIGRKTSQESEPKPLEVESQTSEEFFRRRNSDKSSCYSDDSLSNDSVSIGNQSPSSSSNTQSSHAFDSDIRSRPIDNYEKMQINQELTNACGTENFQIFQNFKMNLDNSNALCQIPPMNLHKNSGSFEFELSDVCSKLQSVDILEMVKKTINDQIPPKTCFTPEEVGDRLSLEYEGGIQIELKIIDKPKDSKGLKMRRISGDHLVYNQLCQQLISCMTVS
ncbi:hypothetical protein JTB14_012171 [Gonioctena quinquepunctata]|nr:hypothetical protein JTB14_012171 [Gonioctena quinquepunctata]